MTASTAAPPTVPLVMLVDGMIGRWVVQRAFSRR
jgi:hypothetical protein